MPDGLSPFTLRKNQLNLGVGVKMKWYKSNQRLFREERDALASKHLQLEIVGPGTAVNQYVGLKKEAALALGVFALEVPGTNRKYEYEIALVFPDDYPKHPADNVR